MNKLELKDKIITLQDELKGLIENGQAEKRELNDTENTRLAEIRSEIDNLNAQIVKIEEEERQLMNQVNNNQEVKRNKSMKLFDLVRGVANNDITDEMRSMVSGNKISLRAINVSTEKEGIENVPEEKQSLDVAIRNNSVLSKMGATWFPNAVGDISIPKYSGSSVLWKGEVAAAEDGQGEFDETNLKPKRLTAIVDISRTFLAQDANSAEALLIADLAAAVAEKFDMTVFGDGAEDDNTPGGIFNGVDAAGALSDMDYESVLDLELGVAEKNGSNMIFVASPASVYHLKGTQTASGLQMVYNGGEIDGYKTITSNSVKRGGIVCLDPKDLAVASWSNIDIIVDTLTKAADNQVRLVVNYFCDAKLKGDRIAKAVYNA